MIKFDPHLFFNPVSKKNFDPPPRLSIPPPKEKFRPPTSFWTIRTLKTPQNELRKLLLTQLESSTLTSQCRIFLIRPTYALNKNERLFTLTLWTVNVQYRIFSDSAYLRTNMCLGLL